jgi:ribosomal-protein-alanine N-acetyltransferase
MTLFDFSYFPTLTTQRLVLRELIPEDAENVFLFRSDAEEQKYNSEPMKKVSEAQALIEEVRSAYVTQHALYWGVTLQDDKVRGLFGFNYWNRENHRAMIGFDLARAYWRQGIGEEGVRAIIQFGFEHMQLNRIDAATIVDNMATLRLLEKLRFQREGTIREHSWQDGAYYDLAMYGLLRSEYARGE